MSTPSQTLIKNDSKTIHSWAMYDWANSAYALVITSAIFPAYYNSVTNVNGITKIQVFGFAIENTAAYSINLGLAFGIIALISPLLSSISDYSSNQKKFMKLFCYLGSVGCMLLFFFTGIDQVHWALLFIMMATIGYSGSIVFYNSFLPAIATEDQQDRVSARGYAYGYIGASTLLIFNLAAILNQKQLGITDNTLLPRVSFFLTGLWWMSFAQITFRKLPKGIYNKTVKEKKYIMNGYHELVKIWQRMKTAPRLKTFLLSFFFYIMGVQTVMFMAASFGEKEIHLPMMSLIITILLLEFVGIAGAYIFAWLSRKIGNIKALIIAVTVWIAICFGSYFIQTALHFYIAGFFIGMVMGGIQSLSRSTYSKLIPKTENNAGYFSFYDVCEKMAMMCGLIMWGSLDHLTGSMRNSIFTLGTWFSIGLIFLIILLKKYPMSKTEDTQEVVTQ